MLLIILFLSVKYYRPFCKYLCPLGAVYGAFHPIAFYRLKINEEKCVGCGACVRTCPMGVDVINHPNSVECIRCGECMKACPTNAIQSTMSELRKKVLICFKIICISLWRASTLAQAMCGVIKSRLLSLIGRSGLSGLIGSTASTSNLRQLFYCFSAPLQVLLPQTIGPLPRFRKMQFGFILEKASASISPSVNSVSGAWTEMMSD